MRAVQQSEAVLVASKGTVNEIEQLLGRTLVVVAHPDDEVIGSGALLQRMPEPMVVFCTDGAPRNPKWWQRYQSREAYASLRRGEAQKALSQVRLRGLEFLVDDRGEQFADQELFRNLPQAVVALRRLVERHRPQALLTHAYEGGHPDHDSCCFITSVVAQGAALPAWEMPLYHRDAKGNSVFQQFVQKDGREVEVQVSAAERLAKARMAEAYASQGDIISAFDLSTERIRPLYAYDFGRPPHAGKLNYELWGWDMNSQEVTQSFAEHLTATLTKGASSKSW
jgi:N-acetylglucosamine malate deacetylase 2